MIRAIATALALALSGCSQWVAVAPRHIHRYDGVAPREAGDVLVSAPNNQKMLVPGSGPPTVIGPGIYSGNRTTARRLRGGEPAMVFLEPSGRVARVELPGHDGEPVELMVGRDVRLRVDGRWLTLQHPVTLRREDAALVVGDADQPPVRLPLSSIEAVEVNQPADMPWFPFAAIAGSIGLVVLLVSLGP